MRSHCNYFPVFSCLCFLISSGRTNYHSALLESKVEGIPAPLKAFSRTPGKHLVDLVNLDMNEDQGMTTFVMRVSVAVVATAGGWLWPSGTGVHPIPGVYVDKGLR